jgi:hypothetical protein
MTALAIISHLNTVIASLMASILTCAISEPKGTARCKRIAKETLEQRASVFTRARALKFPYAVPNEHEKHS